MCKARVWGGAGVVKDFQSVCRVAEKDTDLKHRTGSLAAATAGNKESIQIKTTKGLQRSPKKTDLKVDFCFLVFF